MQIIKYVLIVLIAIFGSIGGAKKYLASASDRWLGKSATTGKPVDARSGKEERVIARIIDGDTIVLNGGEKIRLLGVDAPESKESNKLYRDAVNASATKKQIVDLGKKSTAFTKQLCERARMRCYLRYDSLQPRHDDYGRTLAYVYFPDGKCLNAELIDKGFAAVFRKYNFHEKGNYLRLENAAQRAGRGLWKDQIFRRLNDR